MKKALKITIALVFLSGMIFQMSYGGSGHKKNDPLHHKDLEASSEFGSVPDPNSPLFKKLCAASARVHAPKNADGEYDVFAWIQGGTPDHKKGGYLGGTTKVTWSSVKKYVWQHCPQRHQKWAIIDGTFSINGVNHTGNPKDHIMSDDR